jgi:hypothetical protein
LFPYKGIIVTSDLTDKAMASKSVGWFRWGICTLLFFATALNYVDRQILGLLKPIWRKLERALAILSWLHCRLYRLPGAGWLSRVGVKLLVLRGLLWTQKWPTP